jgi:hypothetical protein
MPEIVPGRYWYLKVGSKNDEAKEAVSRHDHPNFGLSV